MTSRLRLELATDRMRGVRMFTQPFLEGLSEDEWFWCPPQYATHIAWQVGHIAVAEYNLCLRRRRGRTTADESLISEAYLGAFKQASTPIADPTKNLPLEEIRRVFDSVHALALDELSSLTDAELDVPPEQPHPRFKTKLGAVEFSPQHEMVHAGQIAMLRRLMGKPPLR